MEIQKPNLYQYSQKNSVISNQNVCKLAFGNKEEVIRKLEEKVTQLTIENDMMKANINALNRGFRSLMEQMSIEMKKSREMAQNLSWTLDDLVSEYGRPGRRINNFNNPYN